MEQETHLEHEEFQRGIALALIAGILFIVGLMYLINGWVDNLLSVDI